MPKRAEFAIEGQPKFGRRGAGAEFLSVGEADGEALCIGCVIDAVNVGRTEKVTIVGRDANRSSSFTASTICF